MEVTNTLDKFSGAWIEKGQDKYMRMAVKAEYDFSKVSKRIKKPIIIGIRTGVLNSTHGQAACVFRVICETFNLKYVCASKTGDRMYTNFSDVVFYESCVAAYNLISKRGHGGRQHITLYANHINTWFWIAKDEMTRNLFAETVGFPDKERREEAINFLCAGKKLTQTWVDDSPI